MQLLRGAPPRVRLELQRLRRQQPSHADRASRLNPVSLYARTRILSERLLFDRAGDVEPVVLRLATVFGLSPRMRFDLVVNTLTVRAVVNGQIAIQGATSGGRTCIAGTRHVRSSRPRGTGRACRRRSVQRGRGQPEPPHRGLGELVAHIIPASRSSPSRTSPITDYRVDFDKIRTVLAFEPIHGGRRNPRGRCRLRSQPALRDYQNPCSQCARTAPDPCDAPAAAGDVALQSSLARA